MIKVAIHQPNFLPWIGYFHKISMVDKFVFFDDVQFPRGKSFGNRVKIKTSAGEAWITVPVLNKAELHNFDSILIDNNSAWQRKIIRTIEFAYRKAPYFDKLFIELSNILTKDYANLAVLNIELIKYISGMLNFNTEFICSSELNFQTNTEDKILLILKKLNTDIYVSGSGSGSLRYINEEKLFNEGIHVDWQKFQSPVYQQQWGSFMPNLSIIDMIFNCGKETANIILNS